MTRICLFLKAQILELKRKLITLDRGPLKLKWRNIAIKQKSWCSEVPKAH